MINKETKYISFAYSALLCTQIIQHLTRKSAAERTLNALAAHILEDVLWIL